MTMPPALQAYIQVPGHLASLPALYPLEGLPLGHGPCSCAHCLLAAGSGGDRCADRGALWDFAFRCVHWMLDALGMPSSKGDCSVKRLITKGDCSVKRLVHCLQPTEVELCQICVGFGVCVTVLRHHPVLIVCWRDLMSCGWELVACQEPVLLPNFASWVQ